jgi:hypothetical protein
MSPVMVIVLSFSVGGLLFASGHEKATVPATSIYVATDAMVSSAELLRCADRLKEALTPSFGTLVLAKRRTEADRVVQLRECRVDRESNVYRIEWTLARADASEDFSFTRTSTKSQSDDAQMRAATKDLASEIQRRVGASN